MSAGVTVYVCGSVLRVCVCVRVCCRCMLWVRHALSSFEPKPPHSLSTPTTKCILRASFIHSPFMHPSFIAIHPSSPFIHPSFIAIHFIAGIGATRRHERRCASSGTHATCTRERRARAREAGGGGEEELENEMYPLSTNETNETCLPL